MSKELDALLADKEKETPAAASTTGEQTDEEKLALRKSEELANLNVAVAEAQKQLREARNAKKKLKGEPVEEEELPEINMKDPSSKAWDKHINDAVNPLQAEVNQGKAERREYALRQFLANKPSLAKSPEKIKELVDTYEKIRTASELTTEGISIDLSKAYAAVFSEELIEAAHGRDVDQAKADMLFSDIAVSRGATGYSTQKEKSPAASLDEESKRILAKWGTTPEEWAEDKKKFG